MWSPNDSLVNLTEIRRDATVTMIVRESAIV